jgi:hypothetical protein
VSSYHSFSAFPEFPKRESEDLVLDMKAPKPTYRLLQEVVTNGPLFSDLIEFTLAFISDPKEYQSDTMAVQTRRVVGSRGNPTL